jgi:hypothetical protein
MDLPELRELLRPQVVALSSRTTHKELRGLWQTLGLPFVEEDSKSKHDRMSESFDATPDSNLETVATRLLGLPNLSASVRNQIQDALWARRPAIEISQRLRREIARALPDDLDVDGERLMRLLSSLFVLDDDPFALFGGADRSLRAGITRHVIQNRGDWRPETLLETTTSRS